MRSLQSNYASGLEYSWSPAPVVCRPARLPLPVVRPPTGGALGSIRLVGAKRKSQVAVAPPSEVRVRTLPMGVRTLAVGIVDSLVPLY